MVDDLAIQLQKQDIVCSALHGDMRQEMRTSIMKQFKNKQIDILNDVKSRINDSYIIVFDQDRNFV